MDAGVTPRQVEALLMAAETGSIAAAAERMRISPRTVKELLGGVMRKTSSDSSLQAYHRLIRGVRMTSTTTQKIETEDS